MRWAVLLTAILLSGPATAQVMAPTLSCDVIVNGYAITWPKGWMRFQECKALAADLQRKDKTDAKIKCVCQRGVKS